MTFQRILLLPLFAFAVAQSAFAQMEFPPVFQTENERLEYARSIIERIPQVGTSLNLSGAVVLVQWEQLLLQRLKGDEEFLKTANARPPLQTFLFEALNPNGAVTKEFVLREIPPRLAIFRGCVGGDCSTSHSWAYPYSPFERYYFIETRQGKILGYVSAAITKVKDKPTFYLRDVVGPPPGLTPTDIASIVYCFYLSLEEMNLSQMTLMPAEFAHENVYGDQEMMLRGIPTEGLVDQSFQDAAFRERFLNPVVASSEYDRVHRHATVRLLKPSESLLSQFRIQVLDGKLVPPPRDAEATERFWELIDGAAASNDATLLSRNVDASRDWTPFLEVLRNQKRLPLADYYQAAIEMSESIGFPLSQNLIRKHDVMFRDGHLNAPDAFSTDDPKMLRQTMRYLRAMLWKPPTLLRALNFIRNHIEMVENHEVMISAFASLFERHTSQDAQLFGLLWGIGIRFSKVEMTEENIDWMLRSNASRVAADSLEKLRAIRFPCESRLATGSR